MSKKIYFATCELRCGLKKTFTPGEEVPCDEKLGTALVADGHATTDPKVAAGIIAAEAARIEALKVAQEAIDELELENESEDGEVAAEEVTPEPQEKKMAKKSKPAKKSVKPAPKAKALPSKAKPKARRNKKSVKKAGKK